MSVLKCYRADLQRQYKERRTHTKEYEQMLNSEICNIWLDPVYLYLHYWDITDSETGRIIKFIPWPRQEELIYALNSGHKFWVNLKSRRMGFTEIAARENLKSALFKPNQDIIVLSKNQEFANEYVRKIKNQHNWLIGKADFLRSPMLHEKVDMLHFGYEIKDDFGSKITQGRNSKITAFPRGESAVVGATATDVFMDEFGLQPNSHTLFAYTFPVVEGTGARLIISSTFRGFGTKHAQLFRQAYDFWELGKTEKETRFKWFFLGYFDRPGRTQATWDADLREYANPNLLKTEYPRTWQEAFQASSDCYFDVPALQYMLDKAPMKPQFGYGKLVAERTHLSEGIYGKCKPETIEFVETGLGGDLKVFKLYNINHLYIAGIDCAQGSNPKSNYTVCEIFDLHTGEQCAVYRVRKTPEQCADDSEVLCKWYGEPLAIIEKDGPGLAFLQRFRQIYSKIYGRETIDGIVDKVDYTRLGTSTRQTTKVAYMGLVIQFIYKCVKRNPDDASEIIGRSNYGWLYDTVTIEECLNYIETESGRLEADKRAKMDTEGEGDEKMCDDTVMALMQFCIGLKNEGRQYEKSYSPQLVSDADRVWAKAGFYDRSRAPQPLIRDKSAVNRILEKLSNKKRHQNVV